MNNKSENSIKCDEEKLWSLWMSEYFLAGAGNANRFFLIFSLYLLRYSPLFLFCFDLIKSIKWLFMHETSRRSDITNAATRSDLMHCHRHILRFRRVRFTRAHSDKTFYTLFSSSFPFYFDFYAFILSNSFLFSSRASISKWNKFSLLNIRAQMILTISFSFVFYSVSFSFTYTVQVKR